jgi:hypothetical protein
MGRPIEGESFQVEVNEERLKKSPRFWVSQTATTIKYGLFT